MAKRIFATLLTMIMVITMSFCVIAEGETATLKVENIYGTKSTLYVDLSQPVTIAQEGDVTATVTEYGASGDITATVTVDGEAESGKRLAIEVSPELSLDGMYKLTLNVGGVSVEQSFKYKTLLSETFDSKEEAQQQIYLSSSNGKDQWDITEEGYLHRKDMSCYPTALKSGIADSSWTDYTVEYDYISDKMCDPSICTSEYTSSESGEAVYNYSKADVMFRTYFYVSGGEVWTIDASSAYNSCGAVISNRDVDSKPVRYSYLVDETKTEGLLTPVVSGGMGTLGTQTVKYSASMFGKTMYANVKDNGEEIYSSYAEIPADAELSYTSGGFAVTCSLHTWNNGHTYIDNLLAYKLEKIEINYTSDEAVTAYGSKNKLVFKFENDIIDADVAVTEYGSTEIIASTTDYDSSSKAVTVDMESALSLDKIYEASISYGITKEESVSVIFNYDELFSDDFEGASTNLTVHNGSYKVEDGYFVRTSDSYYMAALPDALVTDNWKDYTVEFEYLGSKSNQESDATLWLSVFMNAQNYGGSNWANINGTNFSGFAFTNDYDSKIYYYTGGAEVEADMPFTVIPDRKLMAKKDMVISASLFGNDAEMTAVGMGEDTTTYLSTSYTVPVEMERTGGSFGFTAGADSHALGNTYVDNVVVYKLNVVDLNYTDSEEISEYYGSRYKLIFKFENDVLNAEATVLKYGAEANEVVESDYDAATKTLTVTPETALSLDGAYEVTIKYGMQLEYETAPVVYGFDELFSDDFSDVSYTKSKWFLRDESLLNGEALIDINPYYAKALKTTEENALWKDYTVEFDYIAQENVNIGAIRTFFYVSGDNSAINDTVLNASVGASVPGIKHAYDQGELCYSEGTVSMITDNGTMPAYNTVSESVTLSTSLFDKTAYSVLTKADGTLIYSGHAEVPSLSQTSGKFAVMAWTQPEENAILDNVVAYKLTTLEKTYGADEAVTVYGSKNKLIFKFENDVANAKATVCGVGEAVAIAADSDYDKATKTLTVTPENVLSLDGAYEVAIKYGLALEESVEPVIFGYEVLFEDDFEGASTNLTVHNSSYKVEDGYFVRTGDSYYMAALPDAFVTDNWKDYTVEFEYLGSKSNQESDATLWLSVFMNAQNYGGSNWANINGTNFSGFAFTNDYDSKIYYYTGGAEVEADMPFTVIPDRKLMAKKDMVISASLFGNDAEMTAVGMGEDTTTYLSTSYTVPVEMERTGGSFGFTAGADGHKLGNTYVDNVVAYKIKLYNGLEYDENQTIASYGSKGNLVFKFDEDVVKAKAVLTQGGVSIPAESSYSENTLIVKPEADLDIKGIYDITISYGINYECSQTKKFGYEVLMNEDFSKLASAKENFYYGNREDYEGKLAWTVNEDGQLVKLIDDSSLLTYGVTAVASGETESWKDYTVEFDFIGKEDMGIYNGSASTAEHKNLTLGVFFYTSELSGDSRFLMRVMEDDGANAMYSKTVLNRPNINENKSFTYSASIFGEDVYSKITNITDNEVVLEESIVTAVYKNIAGESDNVEYDCTKAGANGKTSGGFSIAGSYGWNDGSANTFDNVLCYKLYEIDGVDVRFGELTEAESSITLNDIYFINAENSDVTPILAVYGENNKLLGMAAGNNSTTSLTVENIDMSAVKKVKLMLWGSLNGMNPERSAIRVD